MLRHYYISDNLDELEAIEKELEDNGMSKPHFHVLSERDAEVEKRHLNAIEPVLKKDVVHSTEVGALIGCIGAALVLGTAYLLGWTESAVGWLPFAFLAVVVLGFCTWEGGLIGIQIPNYQFKRFQKLLKQGKHVLFVDVDKSKQDVLKDVIENHPKLKLAGTGEASPRWVVKGQERFNSFMKSMP
ncbi:NAD/FAD-utilizing enzyme [Aliiglaciecola sp. CAU 1673]|uniref:NAD/FAD-utilizing enzyme n=1 Tax=Aliiglaciecola sp. CAU 1673 TaxID=3032595 RepID=UPI0023DC1B56|nr:NAD/FAD-utilizing enzyme [Aliiglaciecola sp. CAU 1673]MDF2176963.1 NAD/FAD-utilizing enzyme [Aliiglaciecola sp. CAU 1673]